MLCFVPDGQRIIKNENKLCRVESSYKNLKVGPFTDSKNASLDNTVYFLARVKGFSTHKSKSLAFSFRAQLAVSLFGSTSLRLLESQAIEAVQLLPHNLKDPD